MTSGFVQYRVDGAICTLTFSRPEKKNAFTHQMYRQFHAALHEAGQDPRVRAIVMTGDGGAFTSGNDLHDFMESPPVDRSSPVFKVIQQLVYMDKPLIAAVDGAAVGIGTTMLLHCDMVYASDRSRFHLPFVNLGLTPEAGSSLLLPAVVGMQMAAELLMLGEPFDADTAFEAGLVNEVLRPEAVLGKAYAVAERLADKAPAALQATKRLLREPSRQKLEQVLRDESETFVQRLASPEANEAFSAFFEKRRPDFTQF